MTGSSSSCQRATPASVPHSPLHGNSGATEFITANLKTQLSIRSGHAVLAKGVKTTSKSGQEQTLVLVTARVVEPGPAATSKP